MASLGHLGVPKDPPYPPVSQGGNVNTTQSEHRVASFGPGSVLIPLFRRHGQVVAHAVVDADDAEAISQTTWRLTTARYAARSQTVEGVKRTIYMHRLIAQTPPGLVTDHINGDRLDNRRSNLRSATLSQNGANSTRRCRSGYRGVYLHKPTGRWLAQVSEGGQARHLGIFDTAEEAAAAYDRAAIAKWGDYARLNLVR